jgi:AraC-like DNA-binding protein
MKPSGLALDGCSIERMLDGRVEVVEAAPRNRAFPDRVTDSLGICLKHGADHEVRADGRTLRYPRDTVCVRPPGCVWSARATGPAAFLSVDIEPSLLPPGGLEGVMRFVAAEALPDLGRFTSLLRSSAPALQKHSAVTELVDAVLLPRLARAPHLDPTPVAPSVERARELLTTRVADPPSLTELAEAVGANRFVLLRGFRRRFGVTPWAFVLRLRVERARAMLGRGGDIVEVAHALGFADQSHLSRTFKRTVGLSPAVYRRHAWQAKR